MKRKAPVDPVDPVDPESAGGSGSSTDGQAAKKQCAPAKNWCFTWHYKAGEEPQVDWENLKGVTGGIVGREVCPTTGGLHLQGFLQFEWKSRPFSLGLPVSHWEAARGSPSRNYKYCGKDENFKVWGTMLDWMPPPPLKLITELRPWQQDILDRVTAEPDDRTILWIWEETGNVGKSALTKLLCANHKAVVCAGKAADMKYQIAQCRQKPTIVVFDVPRTSLDYVSYTGIEEIKNGCFASQKYESGMVVMNSPHVLVFANRPPDTATMSADRWKIGKIVDGAIEW